MAGEEKLSGAGVEGEGAGVEGEGVGALGAGALGAERSGAERDAKVGEARETVKDNQADLVDFQKRLAELKEKGEAKEEGEANPFVDALKEIEARAEKGEATRADILALRRGAVDKSSNNKDELEKHLRLAATFLSSFNGGGGRVGYEVNFGSNKMAERFVGLGDMLPANIEVVRVLDSAGAPVSTRAVRGKNSAGRIGYYDEASKQYIAVHSGFKVEVLGTRTDSASGDGGRLGGGVFVDAELARRKLQEEMALFGDNFREDFFNGENEQLWLAPSGHEGKSPSSRVRIDGARMREKVPKPRRAPSSSSSSSSSSEEGAVEKGAIVKSPVSITQGRDSGRAGVLGRGYRPAVRGLPRAVVQEAHRVLGDTQMGFGDEVPVNIGGLGGRTYLARIEWHKHAPSDNVSARLKDWHRGVTIYEKNA